MTAKTSDTMIGLLGQDQECCCPSFVPQGLQALTWALCCPPPSSLQTAFLPSLP